MTKQAIIRLLVAAAFAGGAHEVHAQTQGCEGDCPLPIPRLGPASGEPAPGEHPGSANGPVYGIGGVIGTIGVVGIWNQSLRLGLRERREADLACQGEALGTLFSDRIADMIPSGEPLVQPVVRTLGTKGEHQVTLPDQSQAAHGGEGQAALNQIDDTRD
jgi:hypothetical protein